MLDAFVEGDALGGAEGGERRWRRVGETVAGEETGEVEWGVGQVVVDEPTAHLADHIEIVGEARKIKAVCCFSPKITPIKLI